MGLWLDVVRLGCGGASVGARSTSDDIVAGELGLGLRRNARLVQPLSLVVRTIARSSTTYGSCSSFAGTGSMCVVSRHFGMWSSITSYGTCR